MGLKLDFCYCLYKTLAPSRRWYSFWWGIITIMLLRQMPQINFMEYSLINFYLNGTLAVVRLIAFSFKQISITLNWVGCVLLTAPSGPSSGCREARIKDQVTQGLVMRFPVLSYRAFIWIWLHSIIANGSIPLCFAWQDFDFVAQMQVLNFYRLKCLLWII